MNNLTALLFIVIVSNAGGEGKTLLAQLVQALLQLADEPVTLLDGDAGNRAAKVADDSTRVVGWGVDAIKAAEIAAATKGSHVIFDLGANSLASAREIVDLLPTLQAAYEVAGYRTISLLPVSTNKLGAVEAIKLLAPKLEGFEQAFVKVNRDGSGGYAGALNSNNVVEVGHLAPGFQMYIREPGRTMASAVSNPPAGDHLAPAYVANWMRGSPSSRWYATCSGRSRHTWRPTANRSIACASRSDRLRPRPTLR